MSQSVFDVIVIGAVRGVLNPAFLSIQNSMSGGSRETEVNELTVIPCASPLEVVVRTVTPVANCPQIFLKSVGFILQRK